MSTIYATRPVTVTVRTAAGPVRHRTDYRTACVRCGHRPGVLHAPDCPHR